ncbi:MAG: amidohydrolase, partial [Anaerovoracaceae bacterium]
SKVHYSEEAQIAAAMKSYKHCIENGITSIHDAGELGESSIKIMSELCNSRNFKVGTHMMLHSIFGKEFSKKLNDDFIDKKLEFFNNEKKLSKKSKPTIYSTSPYFSLGTSKFMIDGGSSAPSCATREPYSHNALLAREKGWDREEVAEYIAYLCDAGCQVTAHAIGDLAVEFMVQGYEKYYRQNEFRSMRHRIEHCTFADKDLIEKIAEMNICPSLNVAMVSWHGANFEKFYGERNEYLCAARTMLDKGIKCSIHSDYPSGPGGLAVIDAAVNRIDRVRNVKCNQSQKISVLEALKCYSKYAAYAAFEENIKGSIELGKLADFTILSENILKISPENINKLKVDMTVIDGEIVLDSF